MVAVDANILIYAHRTDSTWHDRALSVITELAEGDSAWAIPWPCIWEFLAIATHPRIYNPPTPIEDALIQIERWLESPTLHVIGETDGFMGAMLSTIRKSKIRGAMVHDARVAALCLHHGIKTLLTADRDFSRFPRLRTRNPLVG